MAIHPSVDLFSEKYRPRFHFTPARNWMNDPNGLVYHNNNFHLFFQHNPQGSLWGNMSWGHAVSKDLYSWEELPVAIDCTATSGIFSGSVVVDYNNTSGFGTTDQPPIVAIYTEHQNDESNQSQCLAFSVDNGLTFEKYIGNPVLDLNLPNFRDPKVLWIDNQWIMVVANPQEFKISFYSSPNLREWRYLSNFGPAGESGGIWECPDLFQIENKWVLIVSLNPGGFQVGSGTQYFVGLWDGTEFVADDKETRWLDYGRDNYAGVTFSNAPNNRRIFIGWMSNWDYANLIPTSPWRGAMTLPRELALKENTLVQRPVPHPKGFPEVSFTSSNGAIRIHENPDRFVEVGMRDGKIFVDCSRAWNEIRAPLVQEIPTALTDVDFRVIVDNSSIEVFAAGGTVVITNLIFVDTALNYIETVGEVSKITTQQLSRGPLN